MRSVAAKMMSRLAEVESVYQGFHDIQCTGEIRRNTARELVIVHYPFASLD